LSGRRGAGALLRKPWLTWVYRHLDAAFYVGARNRDYFLAHGLSDDRLDWVPHSIDNDRFAHSRDCELIASEERRSLDIPANAFVFLFAGKLVPHKQPELLLDAFRALSGAVLPHLVIAGSGPLEGTLKAVISHDIELSRRVHFLGFRNQSQMPATYRIGDVIVLPSSRETWGLTVNEAMASRRPVIVSDKVGCAPDLAGEAAFSSVFPSEQPAALTAAMQAWIVKGRNGATKAGNAAAEFIHGWSTQTAAERLSAAVSSRIRHG
jgi:glycosyltransferase involved in cell wall biosynthesis